jgi:hypothetical protein
MRKFIMVFAFLFVVAPLKAKDFYISQNSSRTSGGSSCSTALSIAWFNNTASWGSGSTQISPGTTVHLCGTFTGTPGEQLLKVRGGGKAGSPVTIKFESGANLTAPYWSAQGAIYMSGVSYVTVDGGGNGIIQNTANGTGRAHQQQSRAVYAPKCGGCVVQNLNIANFYVRTSNSDLAISAPAVNCVYWIDSDNFVINNVTCHDTGWAFAGFGNNFTLEHSNVYNVDHGVAFGPPDAVSEVSIHDNHIHDYANWDSPNNRYHHDGLHLWGQRGGSISNGSIYNNLFDGDSGVNITAHMYLQDSVRNIAVYNNVLLAPANRMFNALWFAAGSTSLPGGAATGNSAYNNSINAGGQKSGTAMFVQSQLGFSATNNVLMGGSSDISVQGGGTLSSSGINNNVYQDLFADYGDTNTFGWQGSIHHTLSDWQHTCHCDANSKLVPSAQIKLSSAGQLLAGSVGLSAGANLTQVATGSLAALAADKLGQARSASGPWDVGAYIGGKNVPLAAPSGAIVTVK